MEDVAAYRERYRAENIGPRYRGWLHFATTSVVSLAAIGVRCVARALAAAAGSSRWSRSSS